MMYEDNIMWNKIRYVAEELKLQFGGRFVIIHNPLIKEYTIYFIPNEIWEFNFYIPDNIVMTRTPQTMYHRCIEEMYKHIHL